MMPDCLCVMKNREEGESEREWFKRCMCMHHWMQTNYYQNKLKRYEDTDTDPERAGLRFRDYFPDTGE